MHEVQSFEEKDGKNKYFASSRLCVQSLVIDRSGARINLGKARGCSKSKWTLLRTGFRIAAKRCFQLRIISVARRIMYDTIFSGVKTPGYKYVTPME